MNRRAFLSAVPAAPFALAALARTGSHLASGAYISNFKPGIFGEASLGEATIGVERYADIIKPVTVKITADTSEIERSIAGLRAMAVNVSTSRSKVERQMAEHDLFNFGEVA